MRQMKKLLAALLGIGSAPDRLYRRHLSGGEQHRFRRGEQHCIPGAAHR